MNHHLLLVEDDEFLGAGLVDNFEMEGYTVDWIKEGLQAEAVALKNNHDLIILDIMLPKKNGIEILKEIRKTSRVPVLMLSAKGTVNDRVEGLEVGADDYLTKPFYFKELLLRVVSLLKRSQLKYEASNSIKIGKAIFDFKSLSVVYDDKKEFLTEKESILLRLFANNTDKVISRDKILDKVWGVDEFPSLRTVDNMIVKIRKWVEANPSKPQFIRSHRGIGYSLNRSENL